MARASVPLRNVDQLAGHVESMIRASRIPGAALAVVAGNEIVFAAGLGRRDLQRQLPLTTQTAFPIASTTKAMNATLLGILVDEGRLAWDAPAQQYLVGFHLGDALASAQVTVRDLVTMRTGLPAHDFVWNENPITRAQLVECIAHLPVSAGLRERFRYNNLTATLAGHIAEVVTGREWNDLVRVRLLEPLGMHTTGFVVPESGEVTCAYHENSRRELLETPRVIAALIAPAGGSIHSTIEDMTRWLRFNLRGGVVAGEQLIKRETLAQIHSPWVLMGSDPAAPSSGASYGLGWFVDTYQGHPRISHTGHLYDVNSCVTLFPTAGLGMVSFTNFASARLAAVINEHAFDILSGLSPARSLEQVLSLYEQKIDDTRRRNDAVPRIEDTAPSRRLQEYAGTYSHPGYGPIEIRLQGPELYFYRNDLILPLMHWHYDAWVVAPNDSFEIHKQHPFERANPLLFETGEDGAVTAMLMRVEPEVAPARFRKQSGWAV